MKHKILILLLVLLAFTTEVKAQNHPSPNRARYQGEILTGYGFGVGDYSFDRVYLDLIQGVRVGKYFFAGIGSGINLIMPKYSHEKVELFAPLYVNLKGYLPVSKMVTLFLSVDVGTAFAFSNNGYKSHLIDGNFYVAPAVGISIANRANISIGYDSHTIDTPYRGEPVCVIGGYNSYANSSAISIKVAYQF